MSPIIDPVELSSAPISPEQRLFVGVIANAVMEASGNNIASDQGPRLERTAQSARAWFVNGGEDFHMVCTLAGLEPKMTRDRVLAYLDAVKTDSSKVVRLCRSRSASSARARSKRVTTHDVARQAGVSPTTVMNVAKAPHKVASPTRARVIAAMDTLRFPRPCAGEGASSVY